MGRRSRQEDDAVEVSIPRGGKVVQRFSASEHPHAIDARSRGRHSDGLKPVTTLLRVVSGPVFIEAAGRLDCVTDRQRSVVTRTTTRAAR
jgi:hypothetical protein